MRPDYVFHETLATFEAFRRLGIPADDIWVGHDDLNLVCQARQGELEFTVCTMKNVYFDDFASQWEKAVKAWKETDESTRQEIWRNSSILEMSVRLVLAMTRKGFTIPNPALEASTHH